MEDYDNVLCAGTQVHDVSASTKPSVLDTIHTEHKSSIEQLWFQDLAPLIRMSSYSIPEEYEWRKDADIEYFGGLKIRADDLMTKVSLPEIERFRDSMQELAGAQTTHLVSRIVTTLLEKAKVVTGPTMLTRPVMIELLLTLLLWKASIVECRGSLFIVGTTLRFLEFYMLNTVIGNQSNDSVLIGNSTDVPTTCLYKAWSVLMTVKNTGNAYFDQGARHDDMETIISETLGDLVSNPLLGLEVCGLRDQLVYRFRGPLWDDAILQKRNGSEVLFFFLKVEGDLFTAIEGGRFTVTVDQKRRREEWKTDQVEKASNIIRRYDLDRDGHYYRTFGWRSVIVYFGTIGSLIFAAIMSALDLGDEGSNAFKRINFFATLAFSIDLVILGLFKIFDRNEKAVTDGLYFKRRVYEIHNEFNAEQYSKWRKALAFDSSKVADAISPVNTCYASQGMTGVIVSSKKMMIDEIKEMFYIIEHGYEKGMIKMVNISTGRQYNLTSIDPEGSHMEASPGYGIAFTGIVRRVRDSDSIDNLGG